MPVIKLGFNMKNKIVEFIKKTFEHCEPQMYEENIVKIQNTNGNNKNSPRACKSGSSVYVLYSEEHDVLYVGETGVSVKSRCFGDGDGAHDKKSWFSEVSYVKHFTEACESNLSKQERKLLEQAFSIYLSPKYYG